MLQYVLNSIKQKVAETMIDRLSFLDGSENMVRLAVIVFGESCPEVDCGLRNAFVSQIHARLPQIMSEPVAWELYADSKVLLKAITEHQFIMRDDYGSSRILSPPMTPAKKDKKGTGTQRVRNGGVYKGYR